MKYAEDLARHRRLSILRTLCDVAGRANESVLRDALIQVGLSTGLTRQKVREDLQFLENAGCIRIEWFDDTLAIAVLQERGEDVAAGRIVIEGVKRPSLGG